MATMNEGDHGALCAQQVRTTATIDANADTGARF